VSLREARARVTAQLWSARASPSEPRSPALAAGAEPLAAGLLVAAVALSLLAMLWRLHAEPFDHGYTRYAMIAAEMIRSGDWIVQRLAGDLYFNKPPLQAWLIAAGMWFAGSTSGGVQHLPNAIAWAASLGWTYLFGQRWFGRARPALAAAWVLATSLAFLSLVRDKRIDPLFAALLTGSFYFAEGFLADPARQSRRWGFALGAWTLLALATLTKGPLAVLFFALVVGSYAAWTGRLRRLVSRESLAGLSLFLALVAVWPILLVRELGLAPTLELLHATDLTTRTGGPLYYGFDLPMRFLPWSLLLPAVIAWLVTARPQRSSPGLRFALCWLLGIAIPLHFSESKHYRYALPLFPALALLVVALWHHPAVRARATPGSWQARFEVVGLGAPLALLLAAAALSPLALWLRPEWRIAASAAALPVIGVGAAAWLGLRDLRRGARLRAFELLLAAVTLTFAIHDGARSFDFAARSRRSELALAALTPVARGAPVRGLRLDRERRGTLLLATSRLIEASERPDEVAAWLRGTAGGRGLVVTDDQGAAQLSDTAGVEVQRREPVELDRYKLVLLEVALGAPAH